MDALSSQATVSGYRAALAGAQHLGKFFPMFMTAAGTVPPAKVLVMGVGVAGLQAIATARRLGAAVNAYDVRAAAKEEAESLGATFVDLGVSAEGAGGYARELTAEELAAQQRGARGGGRGERRGDHDGGGAGPQGARARDGRDGRAHGPRLARHRHGRRQRRQLRADRGGEEVRSSTRGRGRARQPARRHAHARELPLRAQRLQPARAVSVGTGRRARLVRRDRHRRDVLRDGGCTNEAAAELLGVAVSHALAIRALPRRPEAGRR